MKTSEEMARDILNRHDEYKKKRSAAVKRSVTAIACLCICAVSVVFALGKSGKIGTRPDGNTSAETAEKTEKSGIYIEKVKFPKSDSFSTADMLGLIVYDGKIYTQSGYFCGGEELPLAEEYIGYSDGNIDEWSDSSDYKKYLSGTVCGDVYTIKGYDSDFRICISEDGKNIDEVFERLNGVTLKTGEDLFGEKRLSLKDGYTDIQAVPWKHGAKGEHKALDVPENTVSKFVDALCVSPFVEDKTFDFDSTGSVALFFKKKNESVVGILLYENGYAQYLSYSAPGDVYVKISDPVYKELFNAAMN